LEDVIPLSPTSLTSSKARSARPSPDSAPRSLPARGAEGSPTYYLWLGDSLQELVDLYGGPASTSSVSPTARIRRETSARAHLTGFDAVLESVAA
jgi:hypothetical protein